MRAGSLVIVGARPSVGKTSAALGMALAAAQEKLPTVFATLEQSQIDIANRLLSATSVENLAHICGYRIRSRGCGVNPIQQLVR